MSYKVIPRRVSEFSPRGRGRYRLVYTMLEKGPVLEYVYPETSIYSRSEEFQGFCEKPYLILSEKDHFLLIVPRWVPIHAGWLVQQTEGYNVYRVDHYAVWAGLVPKMVLEELEFKPKFETLRLVGQHLVGSEGEVQDAWTRYKRDLLRRERGRGIRIKRGRLFSLACKLIRDGVIPFQARPVKTINRWRTDITLRPYQEEALRFWLDRGSMVLIWPFGAGKTILAVKAIAAVSGPTLIVTPGLSLVGQWVNVLKRHLKGPRIATYTGERKEKGDVVVTTYASAGKFKRDHFKLMVIDEAHHLPADWYSQLAFFKADYRLCLTGSPFREDGRTELIYALGGPPYGSDWERLVSEGWVRKPPIYVHVTPFKWTVLQELLTRMKGRILIYCDTINLGEEASKLLGIPFVHGAHSMKKRLKMVETHKRLICSRIFDEGIDIPDLKGLIELDFLYGSRRQEMQRTGRLMHSAWSGTEYHILMSPDEFEAYRKRLYGLYSKGFSIEIKRE
ncbi:MAG: DEAD/DEAH box helicase [Candidatus Bathyarchaeia archaeon]